MAKSALLFEMIGILRRQPGITVGELARALGRTERTIYRWLNELASDLQTPVFCSAGGYYLAGGSDGAADGLTPEELLALRLSLRSSPLAGVSPVRQFAGSAWNKIKSAASGENLAKAMALAQTDSLGISAPVPVQTDIVERLENAVSSHARLRVLYRSQKSNAVKEHTIDPYAIAFRRHSWYVIGFSREQGKVAQFQLIRFISVEDTGEVFDLPPGFSVEDYFGLSWETWVGDRPVAVKVKFSPAVANLIVESKRHEAQVISLLPDGGVLFEVTVSGTAEIAQWIMGYGKEAEVLEPQELRDFVLHHAMGMIARYTSGAATTFA